MKARIFSLIGVTAALVGACKSNPTADGSGTPAEVLTSFSAFTLEPGDSVTFTAQIVDSRLTPLPGDITFSTCNSAVATVAADPTYQPVPNTSKRAVIHAVNPTFTCIIAASGSSKPDTVTVGVLPVIYPAAFPATSAVGSTITINQVAGLPFTNASTITFPNGAIPPIVAQSASSIQILVPFGGTGPLSITGISVPYASTIVALNTAASFTPTGSDPYTPGDNAWNTAPDISSLIPAAPGTASFVTAPAASNAAKVCPEDRFGFGPSGTCILLKFTLASAATLSFTTDWDGDPATSDVDLTICSDSTLANFSKTTFQPCIKDGLAGASSAKPETAGGVSYPAGTYWFGIQNFAGTQVNTYFVTVTRN